MIQPTVFTKSTTVTYEGIERALHIIDKRQNRELTVLLIQSLQQYNNLKISLVTYKEIVERAAAKPWDGEQPAFFPTPQSTSWSAPLMPPKLLSNRQTESESFETTPSSAFPKLMKQKSPPHFWAALQEVALRGRKVAAGFAQGTVESVVPTLRASLIRSLLLY